MGEAKSSLQYLFEELEKKDNLVSWKSIRLIWLISSVRNVKIKFEVSIIILL